MPNNPSDFAELRAGFDPSTVGQEILALIRELYPICRSITGDGFRQTLGRLQKEIPLEMHEVASGTKVFDWTVPREWNIRDAYVKNSRGERIIDFRRHNLPWSTTVFQCSAGCRWPSCGPTCIPCRSSRI